MLYVRTCSYLVAVYKLPRIRIRNGLSFCLFSSRLHVFNSQTHFFSLVHSCTFISFHSINTFSITRPGCIFFQLVFYQFTISAQRITSLHKWRLILLLHSLLLCPIHEYFFFLQIFQAKVAARRYARCLQKLGFSVKFNNFRVVNVLGTCSMPWAIKIVNFSERYKSEASYEPELHPGVTYKLKFPKATLKIFSTGSITVTGNAFNVLFFVWQFVKPLFSLSSWAHS